MSGNTSSTGGYLVPVTDTIDDQDLEDALQGFAVGVTGLDGTLVRPRWQPQPPPRPALNVTWAAIGITSVRPIGNWGFVEHLDDMSIMRRHEEVEVLASFYGPNSGRYSGIYRDGALLRQNFEGLLAFGIKLLSIGDTTHAPELINEQFVQRSDVMMRLARQIDRTYQIKTLRSTKATIAYGNLADFDQTGGLLGDDDEELLGEDGEALLPGDAVITDVELLLGADGVQLTGADSVELTGFTADSDAFLPITGADGEQLTGADAEVLTGLA